MKKFFAVICMMLMSTAMFAQAGRIGAGINLGYGLSSDYKTFGAGAKFQYEFVENVRAELAGNYWFPKDNSAVLDFDLNFQYLIGIADGWNVYPVAGLSLIDMMITGDAKDALKAFGADTNKMVIGFNAGVGTEYYLTSNLKANLDIKYQYGKKDGWKLDWIPIQLGLVYSF